MVRVAVVRVQGQLPSAVIPHERANDYRRVWLVARAPRPDAIDNDAAPVADLDFVGIPNLEALPRTRRLHCLRRILAREGPTDARHSP
jgi:hypothetical protein